MKILVYLLTLIYAFSFLDLKSQVSEKPFASISFENDYYDFSDYKLNEDGTFYVDTNSGANLRPALTLDRGSRAFLSAKSKPQLIMPRFNLSGYERVDLSFDLGFYATASGVNLEKSDYVKLCVGNESTNIACIKITGNSNSPVGMNVGDTCVVDYNTGFKEVRIKESQVAYTHFVLKNIPTEKQVDIYFVILSNSYEECWVLDNIELRGRRCDSWGNYTSAQVQDISKHRSNSLSLIGDWSAEQIELLTQNIKPIINSLKEIDLVNASFASDAKIEHLFDGANQLCGIYASDMLPKSFNGNFKGINHNCLLHISELSPQQGVNVVKDHYANEISFIDKAPCSVDRQIKYHKVSFVKNFPKEVESGYNGTSGGWQSISLPFYAEQFYALDRDGAEMKPFGDGEFDYDNYLPFWIKNTSATGEFQKWMRIAPNYPYIVSVPNNSAYQDRYRVWGRVSFENTNGYMYTTAIPLDKTMNDFTFHPNVEGEITSQDRYTLNEEGSAFVLGSAPQLPFSSCLLFNGPQSEAPKRVGIMNDGTLVSSILKPVDDLNSGIKIAQVGTSLKITSQTVQKVRIYNLLGILVKTLSLRPNEEQCVNLSSGVYLINGKKTHVF